MMMMMMMMIHHYDDDDDDDDDDNDDEDDDDDGTVAVDKWTVTFGTAHPSTASLPTSCHSMRHCN